MYRRTDAGPRLRSQPAAADPGGLVAQAEADGVEGHAARAYRQLQVVVVAPHGSHVNHSRTGRAWRCLCRRPIIASTIWCCGGGPGSFRARSPRSFRIIPTSPRRPRTDLTAQESVSPTRWRYLPDDGVRDPRTNLAREEAIARHVAADPLAPTPVLRLWRNARNQDALSLDCPQAHPERQIRRRIQSLWHGGRFC